jgi:hypothetical protein
MIEWALMSYHDHCKSVSLIWIFRRRSRCLNIWSHLRIWNWKFEHFWEQRRWWLIQIRVFLASRWFLFVLTSQRWKWKNLQTDMNANDRLEKKTMISTKFWYLNDRRLARVDLMIADELMISNDSADKLFWWSDDWTFSEIDWTFSSIDSTSLIDSMRNDLITMLRKSIDSDDKTILQVSSSISSNLNDSIHFLSSRHINTSELKSRSWIDVIIESFRVFKASTIWRSTRIFLISIIAFSIVIARWIIDEVEKFMTCMRRYVSKISKMSIKSSESTVSLIALTIIWRIISLLTVDSRFSKIIWYVRRSSMWYLFITSIDQWASTNTALMIIVIEIANWRNFLLAKFLSTSINMWSKELK